MFFEVGLGYSLVAAIVADPVPILHVTGQMLLQFVCALEHLFATWAYMVHFRLTLGVGLSETIGFEFN